ncbi:MAG: diguanylate cyclase [Candidatus Methylomirabilis sp.]|nr:diguanylate cyclase [Deltaproteobacteria bacterium]
MKKFFEKYVLYLFLGWTAIALLSFFLTYYYNHNAAIEGASVEARAHYKLNMLYRKVLSDLGGVYASTDRVAPNPYLLIPDRDITTKDEKTFTLVNPAYLTRIVFEAFRQEDELPVLSKITSLKPRNPINAPDAWEEEALRAFEQGIPEATTAAVMDGEPYLRLIRPFLTERHCLKCHRDQGYREGDIRGGISIAVPLRPYYETKRDTALRIFGVHFLLWLSVGAGLFLLAKKAIRNAEAYEEARLLSLHDHLTGLANRRYLEIDLRESFDLAKRYGNVFSVIMADMDRFKEYNDAHGHGAGDLLLVKVAGILIREVRRTDLAVRYGGEEFLILLHQTGLEEAMAAAERMRKSIHSETGLTMSFGVSAYHPNMSEKEDIVAEADRALYLAKEKGRNRVETARTG